MGISKTGCSASITKTDLDRAYKQGFADCAKILDEYKKELQVFKDKQEQGLIWNTPVDIGETVYRINEFAENPIIPMAVVSFEFKGITDTFKEIRCKELGFGGEWTYRFTDFGKTVFLTRSEAEEALARMKGE